MHRLVLVGALLAACAGPSTSTASRTPGSVQADDCRGPRSNARITDLPANATAPPLLALFRDDAPTGAACGRVLVRR